MRIHTPLFCIVHPCIVAMVYSALVASMLCVVYAGTIRSVVLKCRLFVWGPGKMLEFLVTMSVGTQPVIIAYTSLF